MSAGIIILLEQRAYFRIPLLLMAWLCLCALSLASARAHYDSSPDSYYQQQLITTLQFSERSSTNLDGSWLFYNQQFIQQPSAVLTAERVHLPASFQQLTGQMEGYGTFIGHFQLPKEFVGRRIAIWMPSQQGAYRVYLNGEPLARVGEAGPDAARHENGNGHRLAHFIADSEYFTLAIQASSFQNFRGGLEHSIKIGLSRTINYQYQRLMMSVAMISGGVLGIGLFTLVFSFFRGVMSPNAQSMFVFGIFIVFLALHNLFAAPYAYTAFTDINWIWGLRLQYLFSFLAILFFLSYMFLFNQRYLHRWVYCAALLLIAINLVAALWAPPMVLEQLALWSSLFCLLVLVNFIYGFAETLRQKLSYSKLTVCAVLLLFGSFIHDLLLALNLIESIPLSFISTSLYALLIMLQQARNYARDTAYIEKLNNRLLSLNNSLDVKVKERTAQLSQLNAKLELQVKIDALTGAYNRRALNDEILLRFEQTCQQPEYTLAFVMLDVDYFKKYNDHYGHLKGDQVLQQLVLILNRALPKNAYVARYGGEEFALILHNVPIALLEPMMAQVLQAVRAEQIQHIARQDAKNYVTVSMGVAWMTGKQPYASVLEFMKAADQQLYLAKEAGRDQYRIAGH